MKKTNIIILSVVIIIVLIIIGFFAFGHHSASTPASTPITLAIPANSNMTPTVSAQVTQTAAVTSTLSTYENAELGFSLDYPTAWSIINNPSGPVFDAPVKFPESTTIATLEVTIYPQAGKCTFPPVASSTIKENTTMQSGNLTFGDLSVDNTVNSLNYFNRMYTLQQGTTASPFCYYFSFVSITKPSTDASITANNQTRIEAADAAFTAMVKSFAFVTSPAGQSETAHASGK